MIVVFFGPLIDAFALETARRRDIDFATDDRLDAVAHCLAIKLYGAEHVAIIGHGDGRLLELLNALEQLIDLVRAIKQTIFAMTMKMN